MAAEYAGLTGNIGADANAKRVKDFVSGNRVFTRTSWLMASGDSTTWCAFSPTMLCCGTARSGMVSATEFEVYAKNVRIENCHIHHLLNQTFKEQKDSHGITGRPLNLVVRNTEISPVSGDAIQFDPGRKSEPHPGDNVLVEKSFLWTGPLDADYAGFRRGERPGENAFDSKVDAKAPRATITIRNTLMKGWGHG